MRERETEVEWNVSGFVIKSQITVIMMSWVYVCLGYSNCCMWSWRSLCFVTYLSLLSHSFSLTLSLSHTHKRTANTSKMNNLHNKDIVNIYIQFLCYSFAEYTTNLVKNMRTECFHMYVWCSTFSINISDRLPKDSLYECFSYIWTNWDGPISHNRSQANMLLPANMDTGYIVGKNKRKHECKWFIYPSFSACGLECSFYPYCRCRARNWTVSDLLVSGIRMVSFH